MDALTWFRANWDRVSGWVLVAVGLVLLIVASVKVGDSVFLADQLSYLVSAGIGGLSALGLGVGLLVTSALHDEWRKLDQIEGILRDGGQVGSGPSGLNGSSEPSATARVKSTATVERRTAASSGRGA